MNVTFNDDLKEEIETLTAIYDGKEISVSNVSQNILTIRYIAQFISIVSINIEFKINIQNNNVLISITNHQNSMKNIPFKILKKIQCLLQQKYNEFTSEPMPIFQTITYCNDELSNDPLLIKNLKQIPRSSRLDEQSVIKFYADYIKKMKKEKKKKKNNTPTPTESPQMSSTLMDVFDSKWIKDGECVLNKAFLNNFISKYRQLQYKYLSNSKYLQIDVVYHWTYKSVFKSIKNVGLIVPDGRTAIHKTDQGFYGRGIYTSPDPSYAQGYGDCKRVFVCLCLRGKPYGASYPQDLGIGLKPGFDSHFSKDRNQMEWVFFDSKQLLLLYLMNVGCINNSFLSHLNNIKKYIRNPNIVNLKKIKYQRI